MDIPIFTIQRAGHNEQFLIDSAKWNLYQDKESGYFNLILFINCKEGINLSQEVAYVSECTHWELNVVEPTIAEDSLVNGFVYQIPKGYDESREGYITNLYFAEHECTDNNHISILKVDGSRKLIKVEGEIEDIIYYDGSKPKNKVFVEAWFEFDSTLKRSMK